MSHPKLVWSLVALGFPLHIATLMGYAKYTEAMKSRGCTGASFESYQNLISAFIPI